MRLDCDVALIIAKRHIKIVSPGEEHIFNFGRRLVAVDGNLMTLREEVR